MIQLTSAGKEETDSLTRIYIKPIEQNVQDALHTHAGHIQ